MQKMKEKKIKVKQTKKKLLNLIELNLVLKYIIQRENVYIIYLRCVSLILSSEQLNACQFALNQG
jgi:adenine-specific DNA methylase